MNPILQEALGSLLRWTLMLGAAYIVKKGIWTEGDATKYVEAGVVALLTLGWSLWEKYKSRIKLLTALTMPIGSTENDLKAAVSTGIDIPALSTPTDVIPASTTVNK